MILTAYLDESGTHGDSPHTILAGYIGRAAKWRRFDKQWARLLKDSDIQYFHAKEYLHQNGEFKGWKQPELFAFLDRVDALVEKNTLFGNSICLKNEDYDRHYIAGDRPKGVPLDSKYGLCFRILLMHLPHLLTELYKDEKIKLHIVMEAGHTNSGDALRVFDEFKRYAPSELAKIVETVSFANKKECYGTQAADSLALPAFRVEQRETPPVVNFKPEGGDFAESAHKAIGKIHPCFRFVTTPEFLSAQRAIAVDIVKARKAWGAQKPKAISSVVS